MPDLSASKHLIKIHAIALCTGELTWHTYVPVPDKELIAGCELCGTVITAPPTSPFQPGARVYRRTDFQRAGVAREYAIVREEELARAPKNLTDEEVAAMALSALTA